MCAKIQITKHNSENQQKFCCNGWKIRFLYFNYFLIISTLIRIFSLGLLFYSCHINISISLALQINFFHRHAINDRNIKYFAIFLDCGKLLWTITEVYSFAIKMSYSFTCLRIFGCQKNAIKFWLIKPYNSLISISIKRNFFRNLKG